MYYVNYVYANLLSLKYYQLYKRDPQGFVKKYIAMVRNGFDDTPAGLLQKFMGFDMNDPKFVPDCFTVLDGKVRELETLYSR